MVIFLAGIAIAYFSAAIISGVKSLARHSMQDAPIIQLIFAMSYGLGWPLRLKKTEA